MLLVQGIMQGLGAFGAHGGYFCDLFACCRFYSLKAAEMFEQGAYGFWPDSGHREKLRAEILCMLDVVMKFYGKAVRFVSYALQQEKGR